MNKCLICKKSSGDLLAIRFMMVDHKELRVSKMRSSSAYVHNSCLASSGFERHTEDKLRRQCCGLDWSPDKGIKGGLP